MLGIDWRSDRAEGNADWDARVTELLAFRRQQGHVQVTPAHTCEASLSCNLNTRSSGVCRIQSCIAEGSKCTMLVKPCMQMGSEEHRSVMI